MNYAAIAGKCVITNDGGELVWSGKPESYKVNWAQQVPESEDGFVLYNYYRPRKPHGSFQNLVRVRPNGSIVFHAELPTDGDTYVHAELRNGNLIANSWQGFRVEIDSLTGRIFNRIFTK